MSSNMTEKYNRCQYHTSISSYKVLGLHLAHIEHSMENSIGPAHDLSLNASGATAHIQIIYVHGRRQ